MSEWNYVTAAYALTWAVLAGYAIYIGARGRRSRARLEQLERAPGAGRDW